MPSTLSESVPNMADAAVKSPVVLIMPQADDTVNGPAVPLVLAVNTVGEPTVAWVSGSRQNDPALNESAVTVSRSPAGSLKVCIWYTPKTKD